jgi:hypothetical protein
MDLIMGILMLWMKSSEIYLRKTKMAFVLPEKQYK